MASPAELSLVTQTQNPFEEQADQMQKIQDFLARLEEERLKIEAFKRELPLCMQLLNNAMEAYQLQLETHQKREEPRAVLEEFIPLKIEEHEKPSSEKASWMVSAQLWSAAVPITEAEENSFALSSKLALDSNPRSGGAFHPFSKEKRKDLPPSPGSNCSSAISALPELALGPVDNEMGVKKTSEIEQNGVRCSKSGESDQHPNASGEVGPSTQRKARRCWSQDLHRRFVNALQTLGGSQVATPKQIRELMKVDGLTNDEVKSHLQKYRLHTRRPMPAQAPAPAPAPHLVVLGGIWVPTEYATSAAAAGSTLYAGAHPVPPHYCPPPPVAQDYYQITAPTPLAASQFNTHLPPLHRGGSGAALALYKGREASPESELRSCREQSESVEEEEDEEEAEEQNATLVLTGATPSEDVVLKF